MNIKSQGVDLSFYGITNPSKACLLSIMESIHSTFFVCQHCVNNASFYIVILCCSRKFDVDSTHISTLFHNKNKFNKWIYEVLTDTHMT